MLHITNEEVLARIPEMFDTWEWLGHENYLGIILEEIAEGSIRIRGHPSQEYLQQDMECSPHLNLAEQRITEMSEEGKVRGSCPTNHRRKR